MPLRYSWYTHTFSSHPATREGFEKFFNDSDPNVTLGGTGIFNDMLSFSNGVQVAGTKPSYLPASNYSFRLEGYIYIPQDGTYWFQANGDDAVDILIDGALVAYWYGAHGFYPGTTPPSTWQGSITLTKGYHHFIARYEQISGGDGIEISWKKPGDSSYSVLQNSQFVVEIPTKAHKPTTLPIKTCLPVDKNTTFLAHYDVTEEESLFGIKPFGQKSAVYLDGIDDYISIPHSTLYNFGTGNYAYRIKFKLESTPSGNAQIFCKRGTSGNVELQTDATLKLFAYFGYGDYLTSTNTLTVGKWYDVVVTRLNGTGYLFVNGELWGSKASTGDSSSSSNINIGRDSYSVSVPEYANITVSEFCVFNYGFTQELARNMIPLELTGNEPGLVGYWKLNEGSGTKVCDFTTNKNHGTMNGGTWTNGQIVATLRPFEGKFGGGIAIEEATENAIGNGDLADGTTPDTENGSVGTYHTVVPTPFPNPISSDYVLKFSPTGGTIAEMELHPKPGYIFPGAGKYTISCYIWVSDDWDGNPQFLPTRWWNGGTALGTTHGGFPTKRNTWERISVTFDTGATVPTDFAWYFGYPQQSTKGVVYATGFQVEYKPFATSFVNGKRDRGILEYPTAGILNPNAGTINIWVNVRDDLPDHLWRMIFVTKDKGRLDGTETNQIRMGFVNNWYTWHWKMQGSNPSTFFHRSLEVTKGWHMFTITWDKTTGINYYYDGQLKYTTTDTTLIPSQFYPTFWLGTWTGIDLLSNHIIDELRIDNIARTPEEIEQWYYSQAPFYPKGVHRVYA